MNKKLICLLLCFAFLVPALVSCNKKSDALNDTAKEASRYTTTLNVWLVTEEGTDPEQAAAVNEAINKITKAKFKTQLNIKYLTEAEYYSAVEAAYVEKERVTEEEKRAKKAAQEAIREALKRGEVITTTESTTVQETYINEYGIPELKYPVVPDYQVDILFIGSYEKYRQYANKNWLTSMDDVMADSGGQLSYYVHHIFREAAPYENITYGMPNNHAIGEYTFLAVDAEVLGLYGYDAKTTANPSIYSDEFYKILKYEMTKGKTPLYSETGKLDLGLIHYWNYSLDGSSGTAVQHPDLFSIYGATYSNSAKRGDKLKTGLILEEQEYQNRWKRKTEYETTPGFITTDPSVKATAKIVKGGYELKEKYENEGYTVLVAESPRATDEDIYGSMFAIGAYASDESRSMEIISYINTNSELRNLLQYGIENVNYMLTTFTDETDGKEYSYVTPTENNAYHMDINKTGNVFIAYPEGKENVKEWEYQKQQNLEATTEPALGMYFDPAMTVNTDVLRVANAVSAKVKAYMDANMTTVESVEKFFADYKAVSGSDRSLADFFLGIIGADVAYNANGDLITQEVLIGMFTVMRNTAVSDDEKAIQSPSAMYQNWLNTSGVQSTN